MNYGDFPLESLNSLRLAIGYSNMSKAMNKDTATVNKLLDGMETANAKAMELSVNPHIGKNIDIKL